MEDRAWMYTGRPSQAGMTTEWINKTDAFLEMAFGEAAKGASMIFCPCSKCANRKRQNKKNMGEHLCKNGFTADYTRWIYHGEANRMREDVVRPRIEDYDADAGVADMLDDYEEARFVEGQTEEEPEATAKASYDMLAASHKPLHGHTTVSQLDAIGRIMALKSQYSLSRGAFDGLLTVIGSLLPKGHILPKSMYEARKLLHALKMPYEQIHACKNGCVLYRKEYAKARSTSASPAIRPRQDTSRHEIQALQALQGQLEEETRKRQELEQRMSDVLTYMQSLSAATGVPPPASLFAQPPPPDPYSSPRQSAASNDPHATPSPNQPSPNQPPW